MQQEYVFWHFYLVDLQVLIFGVELDPQSRIATDVVLLEELVLLEVGRVDAWLFDTIEIVVELSDLLLCSFPELASAMD